MRWGLRRGDVDDFYRRYGPWRRRVNPVLVIGRWRRELALAVMIPYGLHHLAVATHPVAAAAIAIVALVGMFASEPGRMFVKERAHAVLVEHRLRVGMVEARILSWAGWLPAIMWSKPVTRGVRVHLWCPAGVDVTAFLANRELLAAACWASDVEVARHRRWAQVVVLLIVLRNKR